MSRRFGTAVSLFFVAASLCGCAPEIGDECGSAVDCSQTGDRLCDTTQPGGYCTVFNCEPDTCPGDEAVCVAFDAELDPACQSADDVESPRFERTFCMKGCEGDDDCRSGYECLAPTGSNAIVDIEPVADKVCLPKAPRTTTPAQGTPIPSVCKPADAGADSLPPPYEPDGGTGAGGAGGASGAGGGGGVGGGGGAGGA